MHVLKLIYIICPQKVTVPLYVTLKIVQTLYSFYTGDHPAEWRSALRQIVIHHGSSDECNNKHNSPESYGAIILEFPLASQTLSHRIPPSHRNNPLVDSCRADVVGRPPCSWHSDAEGSTIRPGSDRAPEQLHDCDRCLCRQCDEPSAPSLTPKRCSSSHPIFPA